MLEDVTAEYPSFAASQCSDRSCSLVVVEESDLSKADHGLGWLHLRIRFQRLDELYFGLELGIVWLCAFHVDGDFACSVAENVVLMAHVTIPDDHFTFLELLLEHCFSKDLVLHYIQVLS